MAKVKYNVNTAQLDKIIKQVAGNDVKKYTIADGVEYGLWQEIGTSRNQAQPFMIPAFEQHTKQLGKAIGQAIERGVDLNDVFTKVAFDVQDGAAENAPVDTGALRNSIHVEVD